MEEQINNGSRNTPIILIIILIMQLKDFVKIYYEVRFRYTPTGSIIEKRFNEQNDLIDFVNRFFETIYIVEVNKITKETINYGKD